MAYSARRSLTGALAARDRLERLEVRGFEVDHVCALWRLDFHDGSRKVLTRQGDWVTPMLMEVGTAVGVSFSTVNGLSGK